MSDCIKRIVEQSNGAFNKDEAKELLDEVDKFAKRRQNQGADYDQAVADILTERANNVARNVKKQRAHLSKNIMLRTGLLNRTDDMVEQGLDIRESLQAILVGIEKPVEGGRNSVYAKQVGLEQEFQGKYLSDLAREDLLEAFNSQKFDREIAQELWERSKDGQKGISGSKEASRIADILHETQETIRIRLNKAGADIGKVDGFVMNQTHDHIKMNRAGKDKWIGDVLPLLDHEKTFGTDDPLEFLSSAYDAMVTGVRLEDSVVLQKESLFQFKGAGNLGKRLSQSRLLHFKDSDSFLQYNETFGLRSMNEGIQGSITFGAKNIGIMESLGTNPQAMVDKLIDDVKKKYRTQIPKDFERRIQNFSKNVTGETQIAANVTLANTGSVIRALQSISKLGGAVISSIADIPLRALELQYQGKNILSSYATSLAAPLTGFKTKKAKLEYGRLVGVGFESIIGDVGARFTSIDSPIGTMSKLQRKFFKLNGLAWWTDTMEASVGRVMSNDLAMMRSKSFDKLTKVQKDIFNLYDIKEADWDAARSTATKLDDGNWYIGTDAIENADTRNKFFTYFTDRTHHAVIRGGAREQAILNQGLQRGTPLGEAIRFMTQFKQFPVALISKVWGRELYAKGKADVPALAQLIIMSGIFGYAASSAKDIAKGKTPKDPLKTETIFASFAQGGGLGIFGDFLFSDMNRYGGGVWATALGPTAGTIEDTAKVLSSTIRGELPKAASQTVRLVQSNTPFANLFYVKPALDNLMMYQIHEELNPGYLARMERRMRKETGQEFFINPR